MLTVADLGKQTLLATKNWGAVIREI